MRTTTHVCGGTLITGGSGETAHTCCDRCGAFAYDSYDGEFPGGTDKAANQQAWDDGDECSPGITDEEIELLRDHAGEAGDLEQVELCDRALDGDQRARGKCVDAILDARAQQD